MFALNLFTIVLFLFNLLCLVGEGEKFTWKLTTGEEHCKSYFLLLPAERF